MEYKVAIVSDSHGLNRKSLGSAFKEVEWVLHAGDFETQNCLNYFKNLDTKFFAVRGNVDFGQWAQSLPKTQLVTIGTTFIYMVHNLNDLDIAPEAAGCRFVIFGHTHKAESFKRNGVHYINPGSVGPKRKECSTSLALLEFDDPETSSDYCLKFIDVD